MNSKENIGYESGKWTGWSLAEVFAGMDVPVVNKEAASEDEVSHE